MLKFEKNLEWKRPPTKPDQEERKSKSKAKYGTQNHRLSISEIPVFDIESTIDLGDTG